MKVSSRFFKLKSNDDQFHFPFSITLTRAFYIKLIKKLSREKEKETGEREKEENSPLCFPRFCEWKCFPNIYDVLQTTCALFIFSSSKYISHQKLCENSFCMKTSTSWNYDHKHWDVQLYVYRLCVVNYLCLALQFTTRKNFTLTLYEDIAMSKLLHNICTTLSRILGVSMRELNVHNSSRIYTQRSSIYSRSIFFAFRKRSKHTNTPTWGEKRTFSL